MKTKWINLLTRGIKLAGALVIAGIVVWRGDLSTGRDINLTTSLMSLLFAMAIVITGLALTFETDESR